MSKESKKEAQRSRSMKLIWGFEDRFVMVPRVLLLNARKLGLKANHVQLIATIMLHKWDERLPYVGVERLAKLTGWSDRMVQRTLKDLIAEADDHDAKKAAEKAATKKVAQVAESSDDDDERPPPRPPLYLGLLKRIPRTGPDGNRTADAYDFSPLFAKLKEFAAAAPADLAEVLGVAEVEDEPVANDDAESDPVQEQPEPEQFIVIGDETVTDRNIYDALHWASRVEGPKVIPKYDPDKHGVPEDPLADLFEEVRKKSKTQEAKDLSIQAIVSGAMWGVFVEFVEKKGLGAQVAASG